MTGPGEQAGGARPGTLGPTSGSASGLGLPTTIGVAGEPATATVDQRGAIRVPAPTGLSGGDLVVTWAVRGEDRWYVAAEEVTVRQRLVRDMPVPETSMRVGTDDVTWRPYGVATAAGPVVVVEVGVGGRLPVALAMAIRRADGEPLRITLDPAGSGAVVEERDDGTSLTAVSGPRVPSVLVAARDLQGALAAVDDADTDAVGSGAVARGALVVAVWPLAHGSTTGFVLPLGEDTAAIRRRADFGVLGSAEQVAHGWERQLDATCRLDWPDDVLAARARRERTALVLDAPHLRDAEAALVLDRWGHHADAAVVLANLTDVVDRDPGAGAGLVVALAEHARFTADPDLARASVPTVLAVVDALGRAEDDEASAVRRAAATLLRAASEPDAAAAVLAPRGPRWFRGRSRLTARAPIGPGRSPAGLLRAAAVADDGDGGIDLLPGWEPRFRGAPIEGAGLPTSAGRLSFALRWHGTRPAVLWELEPPDGVEVPEPTLRASALDPTFVGRGRRGEALLAEPATTPTMTTAPTAPPAPPAVPPSSSGSDDTVTFS